MATCKHMLQKLGCGCVSTNVPQAGQPHGAAPRRPMLHIPDTEGARSAQTAPGPSGGSQQGRKEEVEAKEGRTKWGQGRETLMSY